MKLTLVGLVVDPRTQVQLEAVFQDMLEWCETYKVAVVTAAGNSPEKRQDDTLPQRLGTPDNNLITVGGVEPDGTVFTQMTPAEPGQGGWTSVYAPARDIIVPAPGEYIHTGTSQAAAIVVSGPRHEICFALIII